MNRFLIFQLYGPMSSWGEVAMGTVRPSLDHPTPSAVYGLLAAALGIHREESERLSRLREESLLGVMSFGGRKLGDYHTAQAPQVGNKSFPATRKDELGGDYKLSTILSNRAYLADGYNLAGLVHQDPKILDSWAEALRKPLFPLYLGRKAHVPALPCAPRLIEEANLKAAFDLYCKQTRDLYPETEKDDSAKPSRNLDLRKFFGMLWGQQATLVWQKGIKAGVAHRQKLARRTVAVRRDKWLFEPEELYYANIDKREEL